MRAKAVLPLSSAKLRRLARKMEELAETSSDLKKRARRKVLARDLRVIARVRAHREAKARLESSDQWR